MGMIDIILSLVIGFLNLTGRTKALVLIGLAALFTVLWASAFGIRVAGTYYASEYQYALDVELNRKCKKDPDMRRLVYHDCKRAESGTQHSLFHNAWWGTWNNSYVCGSSPCVDVVFGNDSTFVGVLIRVMIVAMTVTAIFIFVVYMRRLLYFGDTKYKDNATQRYSRDYKYRPREKQQPLLAISDVTYSSSSNNNDNTNSMPHPTKSSFWRADKTDTGQTTNA